MKISYKFNFSIQPIPFRLAKLFVRRYHSYRTAPRGCLFCLQANYAGEVCGVAIVGRPISPDVQDGLTCEMTRLALKRNYQCGASFLASRAWRAAKSLGYVRMVSYVADTHLGTSLVAAGFKHTRSSVPTSWHNRRVIDTSLIQSIKRFEISDSTKSAREKIFVPVQKEFDDASLFY
jgi:hypothetical protein